MFSSDDSYAYSIAILAAAPMAGQLALAPITWTLLYPVVAIPVISLLLTLGQISNTGPIITFKRIVPLAAGLGWAFTWLVGERLYIEGLRAVQNILYLAFSIRFNMDWAIKCNPKYSSEYCNDFHDPFGEQENMTSGKYSQWPDNFWPAQEFNREVIRGNHRVPNLSLPWEPNEWYLGHSTDIFYFALPSLGMLLAHCAIWGCVYFALTRFFTVGHSWFVRLFVLFPVSLYIILIMGMSISGFHFRVDSVQHEIEAGKVDKDPMDFWTDVRGLFKTSILMIDYSQAFTGLLLFATSKLKVGANPMKPLLLVPMMMVVPVLLTILRSGCEGHIADQKEQYRMYMSTEEMLSYDVMPVCFATSKAGSLWSIIYFTAQLFYTSLGPMVIYASFIHQSFLDEFPVLQNHSTVVLGALVAGFAAPSLLLYMPLGTKIITLLRYTSQGSLIQILAYIAVFFVYGWQNIECDYLMLNADFTDMSWLRYMLRPISPVFTFLMFTLIPMLLFSKFVAVFDLLLGAKDVVQHIDMGVSFIPGPLWLQRLFGYSIMFGPLVIVTGFASYMMFSFIVRHKLRFTDLLKPSPEWSQHTTVNTPRPRPHSFLYGMYNSLTRMPYQSALFIIFIIEAFVGLILIGLFFMNTMSLLGLDTTRAANDYRSSMLFIFVLLHLYSLLQMKKAQTNWDSPDRLTLYICVATLECAMLNGYMWMFISDHPSGLDLPPFLLLFTNSLLRCTCIAVAIVVRHNMKEMARPTRTRDATEIYEVDTAVEMDAEDESPIIFDLTRA